jgi:uncharacterized protein YecE (DUF72 family)
VGRLPKGCRIGTSGWHYKYWRGPFYPEDLALEGFLEYYAGRFQTVEINNSFYQLPQEKTLRQWRQAVPENFIFAVKASRFITHMKKLKDPQPALATFLERVKSLGEKLGPILFQLPPRWRFNPARLDDFLKALPREYRYTMEFRDPSWLNDRTYAALSEHRVAFCIYDFAGFLSPMEVTANFVYLRLHGPEGPYQGQYQTRILAGWSQAISGWLKQGKEVFCYFDNDEAGYAAQDAWRLQQLVSQG